MIVDLPTPCFGKSDLFDSTHLADHNEAKALCATCPEIETCKGELQAAREKAQPAGGPEGTWAGERVGVKATDIRTELDAQEAAYTDVEVIEAHFKYTTGDRSDWAVIGHRIYRRQLVRRRKNQKNSAA